MVEYSATVRRTKKAISGAFIDILSEKSFEKISVQNILDGAEVNKSTFYRYFQDKYDLTKQILADLMAGYNHILIENKDQPFVKLLKQIYRYNEKNRITYSALFTVKTKELNIFDEYMHALSEIYKDVRLTQSKPSKIESYIFADLHYLPIYFHITENLFRTEDEYINDIYASTISAFANFFKVDVKLLTQFLDSHK